MTRHLANLALLAAAIALVDPTVIAQETKYMGWEIDGERRRAIVYVPSATTASGKAPLVLSFHGRGDNAENFQYTDMHKAWPEAVVVYFEGLHRDGLRGWQVEKGQEGDRDLKLVDAALATLRQKFRIDDSRIYAIGFSNGAGFTYLLWAERPDVFAAYAPVAGRLRSSVQPKQPKPVFHIVGERDARMFAGGKEDVEAALRIDGHSGPGEPCGDGCTIFGRGSLAPVMTWVHPWGHDYPDGVSDRVAKFFRDYQLRLFP